MKKFILLSIMSLTACSTSIAPIEEIQKDYDPTASARIRLYGQNNYSTRIYNNDKLNIQVGGVRATSFNGLIKEIFTPLKSISIGIPKTKLIDDLAQSRSGITAGLYFEEYAIPGNSQYTISTIFRDGGTGPVLTSCNVNASVYLENAIDYEVFADIIRDKCVIKVYKIINDGISIKSEPVLIQ